VTTDAWIQARNEFTSRQHALDKAQKAHKLLTPRQHLSLTVTALRLTHLARITAIAFWRANTKAQKHHQLAYPKTVWQALAHKNTVTLLSIYHFAVAHHIPLEDWFLAQFDILSKMPQLWITCCQGQKAFERYTDWDKRQRNRYIKTEDRENSRASLQKSITRAILTGHKHARDWQTRILEVEPPSLSAALAFLHPAVTGWYLVAHECFRDDLLESGLIDDPHLMKLWERYLRSPQVRLFCKSALAEALTLYGPLELRK
jgi:hypothetical protein